MLVAVNAKIDIHRSENICLGPFVGGKGQADTIGKRGREWEISL